MTQSRVSLVIIKKATTPTNQTTSAPSPPATAKDKDFHKHPPTRHSAKGISRRLKKEGDELTIELRARFEMRNEEIISVSGFGGQIDGDWHTCSVLHRIGGGAAITQATCWKE